MCIRDRLWGLAAAGPEGVRRTLRMLQEELREAMALCGAARIEELGPEIVFAPDTLPPQ